jgi:hypothetical protein
VERARIGGADGEDVDIDLEIFWVNRDDTLREGDTENPGHETRRDLTSLFSHCLVESISSFV